MKATICYILVLFCEHTHSMYLGTVMCFIVHSRNSFLSLYRNLFFRISHLTQLGVKLVFAIEGAAPDLKLETMSKRQNGRGASRYNHGRNREIPAKKPTRSRFNGVLREVRESVCKICFKYCTYL